MDKTGFWEMCVRTADLEGVGPVAKQLGWRGIGWIVPWEGTGRLKEAQEKAKSPGMDVSVGVIVKEARKEKVRRIVKDIRKSVELIFVAGGDPEVNRIACEMPEVDVLLHPWGSAISIMGARGESGLRTDSGMDSVMARLAAKNRVAIGFGFNEMLRSNKRARVQLMSNMLDAAKLARKAGVPFVLTAEAREPMDMRAPGDLMSFGRIMGLPEKGIREALSGGMVRENRKRLGAKWIAPGVELE